MALAIAFESPDACVANRPGVGCTGQNLAVTPVWLGTVLGNETIAELADKTGLTRVNLLSRLAQVLPDAVDRMTPEGVIPSADAGSEADRPVNQYGVGQTGSTTV